MGIQHIGEVPSLHEFDLNSNVSSYCLKNRHDLVPVPWGCLAENYTHPEPGCYTGAVAFLC